MPSSLTGINGKIADAFNDIALVSERRAKETTRVTHAVGKEGQLKQRMNIAGVTGGARRSRGDQYPHRRSRVADDRSHARDRRGGEGRSRAIDGARSRRPAARGRVSPLRQAGQQHDRPAVGVHVRGDAGRARSRHRGETGRSGAGEGRLGCLERTHRVGQSDGRQPHRPGPQHCRRDDCRRQRRSLQEDHGRRSRRDPAAQGGHQHDGRSAARIRCRGDTGRA